MAYNVSNVEPTVNGKCNLEKKNRNFDKKRNFMKKKGI